MHSHMSIVDKANAQYVKEIDRASCIDLFKTRKLFLRHSHIIDGLKVNQPLENL